jgi:hypothetical protein
MPPFYYRPTNSSPSLLSTVTVCNAVPAGESVTLIPPLPTVIPSHIPPYASACSGSARYSSACECVGVTPVTTTVPTPTAFTVSHTSTVAAAPTLNAVQFYNGFVCDPTDNILTDTPAVLDVCTLTSLSYSLNFASFVPAGGLTAAECSVNFYTTHDCSGGPQGSAPVDSTSCFNFLTYAAIMLVCSCPA